MGGVGKAGCFLKLVKEGKTTVDEFNKIIAYID